MLARKMKLHIRQPVSVSIHVALFCNYNAASVRLMILVKFTVTEATDLVPFHTTSGPGILPSNAATMDDKNSMYFFTM